MSTYRVGDLPADAIEAAGRFHGQHVPAIRDALAGAAGQPRPDHLVILFGPAPVDHRAWRLAVVQDLARASAPIRINAVSGDDEEGTRQAVAYLASAPGITGQLLAVDGKSAQTR